MQAKHIITRAQLILLDAVEAGIITVAEAAREMERTEAFVRSLLAALGMRAKRDRPRVKRVYKRRPDRALICKRCGILLSEAPVGDGRQCGWCIEEQLRPPAVITREHYADAHLVAVMDVRGGH